MAKFPALKENPSREEEKEHLLAFIASVPKDSYLRIMLNDQFVSHFVRQMCDDMSVDIYGDYFACSQQRGEAKQLAEKLQRNYEELSRVREVIQKRLDEAEANLKQANLDLFTAKEDIEGYQYQVKQLRDSEHQRLELEDQMEKATKIIGRLSIALEK